MNPGSVGPQVGSGLGTQRHDPAFGFCLVAVLAVPVFVEVEEGERRTPKAPQHPSPARKQDGTRDRRQEQEAPKRWKVPDKVPAGFRISLRSV